MLINSRPFVDFSFMKNEMLDMRFDDQDLLTAREIVNKRSEKELGEIFSKYGEERYARRIAKTIFENRRRIPINTTADLVEVVRNSVPKAYWRNSAIHPATRVFQALRIAVNDELNSLQDVLEPSLEILKKGGRIAVITFQSLEDRIVKRGFRNFAASLPDSVILTKKPLRPRASEIISNPRARSAKMRVMQK